MSADGSFRLAVHDTLPSTSDLVASRALAGEPEGLAVLARRQTAGRGREGRPWESPSGNLHLSVLLRPGGTVRDAPRWALLTAVALAEALDEVVPNPSALSLKWPNDLLLNGAKLAGILADASADGEGGLSWLCLGIGVNLAHAPALPDRATASLADLGLTPPAPEDFTPRLLSALDRWRGLHRAQGFEPVRVAWLKRGPRPGAPLHVRRPRGQLSGRFAGLGEDGSLLLATAEGRLQAVVAGEVSG